MLLPNRDENGRPNHIEVALANMHTGAWYMWTDNSNRIYANLILKPKIWIDGSLVDNPYSKPTEKECTDKLKEIQDAWDLENNSYKSKRRAEYPSLEDCIHAILDDDLDNLQALRQAVKEKYPK